MMEIKMSPIGTIHTPYHAHDDIPIQGRFKPDQEGCAELKPEYQDGLKDLDGFSHAILLYHLHGSSRVKITGKPFLESVEHGIFAIRTLHRPNHIGLSVVKIVRIENNLLYFNYVDMLDGTPLLDIKPYVTHFDCFPDAVSGWIDKHFENECTPERATTAKSMRDVE